MKKSLVFIFCCMGLWMPSIMAQTADSVSVEENLENLKGKLSGLEEDYQTNKPTILKLAKIKLSGYVQVQGRSIVTDSVMRDSSAVLIPTGKFNYKIGDFSGGAFPDNVKQMFQVRRGRLKLTYDNDNTQAVLQLDCVPKGVTIKDAYIWVREPWMRSLALKGGVFDRPFGFEISYSSSNRESPERSRLFQTLFKDERDLGASLEFSPADNMPFALKLFNLKAGVFTGNAIADEFDNNKDFIGRLGVAVPILPINMEIDGGYSMYIGDLHVMNDTLAEMVGKVFTNSTGHRNSNVERRYFGGDVQVYYDIPVLGGLSLRGEYISGTQPGTKSSSVSQNTATIPSEKLYMRNFSGFYAMWVQNINPINSQFVLKYDVYDPNTEVESKDITASSGLINTELQYKTLGLGLVYHWDENIKFIAYYDHVTNETMDATYAHNNTYRWYTKELSDDVFTFRVQYKF